MDARSSCWETTHQPHERSRARSTTIDPNWYDDLQHSCILEPDHDISGTRLDLQHTGLSAATRMPIANLSTIGDPSRGSSDSVSSIPRHSSWLYQNLASFRFPWHQQRHQLDYKTEEPPWSPFGYRESIILFPFLFFLFCSPWTKWACGLCCKGLPM